MSIAKELNARLIGLNPGRGAYRVLVVDDETIIRNLVSRVLKSVGFDVVGEATDGLRGVQMYKEMNPDIVVMDVSMPNMNGLSALKQIMKLDKTAKVVMLTSETEKGLVTEILKAGAAEYMVKPIDRKIIMEKFVNILMNI